MANLDLMVPPDGDVPNVLVVGAGVSGCACGAVLADLGVHVTLLNAALDGVNLPAYGPHLVAGPRGWRDFKRTMEVLPLALRLAWLTSAAVPKSGTPVVIVDRRAVSIETKRALERMPGLKFRQALVTDLRLGPVPPAVLKEDPRAGAESPAEGPVCVAVDTAFGESIEADAVVIAVGLGLGGCVTVGEDSLQGGRYGETVGDGLKSALERLGAVLGDAVLEVGSRFAGGEPDMVRTLAGLDSQLRRESTINVAKLIKEEVVLPIEAARGGLNWDRRVLTDIFAEGFSIGDGDSENPEPRDYPEYALSSWPESYPPAVHWCADAAMKEIVMSAAEEEGPVALISSDGRATGEVYISPEGERMLHSVLATIDSGFEAGGCADPLASRLHHVIHAHRVQGLRPDGRLTLESGSAPPVWVVGRAAGASNYLDSLRSGAVTGLALARFLLKGSAEQGDENVSRQS